MHRVFLLLIATVALTFGCEPEPLDANDAGADTADDAGNEDVFEPPEGTSLRFAPDSGDFFDLPFPDDARAADGDFEGVFSSWPGSDGQDLLEPWFAAGDRLLDGWGLSSAVFGYFEAPIDESTLPESTDASVDFDDGHPSVFLVDVDPESDHRGEVLPITCQFRPDAGSYHDENQLGCISPFGVTRRPATTYALVITDRVLDANGEPVVPDEAMARLLRGDDVTAGEDGIDAAPYAETLDVVEQLGVDPESVASAIVFTTDDHAERIRRVAEWYRNRPTPEYDAEQGLSLVDQYEDYAVLEGYYDVPVIQEGERPYSQPPAGRIVFDEEGTPEMVDEQTVRFYLTIPRAEMPADGYPALMFMHGSGGVAEQLMHRGPRPDESTPAPEGSGPASVVAPYGVGGFSADFNLHGMRGDPPDTTGLKLYNLLGNPAAAVDNFIVAASEIGLHARLLESIEFTVDDVEGLRPLLPGAVSTVRFNGDAIAAMGQSMGSTIGLPALTVDSTIDAGVFSGSGGVLIEVALEGTEPINIGDSLRIVLNYESAEEFDRYDPILSAVQHIWDLVDPVAHARHVVDSPHDASFATHALQHSGLEDAYFSTESRAALTTAMGAQLVEPVLEQQAIEQMRWRGLDEPLALPASGNRDGITSIAAQYEPDGVMHGHHVAYQRDDAMAQYACFVRSLAAGDAPVFRAVEDAAPESCEF